MAQSTLNPAEFVAFGHAAAGHEGVLSDESGSVVIKPCTVAEKNFYEQTLIDHQDFAAFLPIYMGTLQLQKPAKGDEATSAVDAAKEALAAQASTGATSVSHDDTRLKGKALETELGIVLSNAAAGFKKPNVLDLKLGAQLWDDAAPPEKRARLDKVAAETTSSSLGFRIAGMKVWQGPEEKGKDGNDAEGFRVYDKFYGRKFTADNVRTGLEEFFFVENAGLPRKLAEVMLARVASEVSDLQRLLEKQESRMYSASILIVIEGDGADLQKALNEEKFKGPVEETIDDSSEEEAESRLKSYTVKMIDFAHAKWTPGLGPDENVLKGVRSVRKLLEEMAEKSINS
ncbi:MAG: hypothetical protein M1814_000212 [Vezdaea aestivalis]|nr:MAG: hypothetical protein M1814_000212 [Vezdaea aestivalis]